ncbi:MAG: helix-turn-helix domain-containing protein [Geminicoccaceae bacterium]
MLDTDQRRLLGAFIRTHRERVRPEAGGGRRRTPGLRREELAARAGISATWCAWLEQGRAVQASPEALGRLARALALTRAERAYLFELAGRLDPEAPPPRAAEAPASLRALVEAVACPAYGLDQLWRLLLESRRRPVCSRAGWMGRANPTCCASSSRRGPRAASFPTAGAPRAPSAGRVPRRLWPPLPRCRGADPGGNAAPRQPVLRASLGRPGRAAPRGRPARLHPPRAGALLFEQHSFVPGEARPVQLVLLRPVR